MPRAEAELLVREPLQLQRFIGAPLQPGVLVQAAPALLSATEERLKSVRDDDDERAEPERQAQAESVEIGVSGGEDFL